jgi:hypothetical protein
MQPPDCDQSSVCFSLSGGARNAPPIGRWLRPQQEAYSSQGAFSGSDKDITCEFSCSFAARVDINHSLLRSESPLVPSELERTFKTGEYFAGDPKYISSKPKFGASQP